MKNAVTPGLSEAIPVDHGARLCSRDGAGRPGAFGSTFSCAAGATPALRSATTGSLRLRRIAPIDGWRPTSTASAGRRCRARTVRLWSRVPPASLIAPEHSLARRVQPYSGRDRVGRLARWRSPTQPARQAHRACRPRPARGSPCCAPPGRVPSTPPQPRNAERSAPDTAHSSGASAARNAWRRSSTNSVASCCGLHPSASNAFTLVRTPPASDEATADTTLSSSGRSGSSVPEATARSRAGERVASRAMSPTDGRLEASVVDVEPDFPADRFEQFLKRVGADQAELVVLGPAPDRLGHLLRVGRGEHEDHVTRGLFEGLEQRVRRPRWSACGPRRRCRPSSARVCRGPPFRGGRACRLSPLFDAASSSWTSIDAPCVDGHAGGADAVGLAVEGICAVEGHGQDPGRLVLPVPRGSAEQVSVATPPSRTALAAPGRHGPGRGLVESRGPKPPIERRRTACLAHGVVILACGIHPTLATPTAWSWARRPGNLRHTERSAESCCRQALTRFTCSVAQDPTTAPGQARFYADASPIA